MLLREYANNVGVFLDGGGAVFNVKHPSCGAVGDGVTDDTAAIQGKLPANKFMGSSDGADDDGTLNALTPAGPTKTEMDAAHGLLATEAKQDVIDAIVDLIKTAADSIKLETDKLTLGDAGAGQAGSIVEEIENRPTTAMRGTDNAATEAKQDIIDAIVDELKAATIIASGIVETSGSNSSTQVQTDLKED